MIKNFKKDCIGPCSYDLRLGTLFIHNSCPLVDLSSNILPDLKELKLPYVLKPGEYVLGSTIEELDLNLKLSCLLFTKSTSFRIGLNIICSVVDPGYRGNIVFGILNVSSNPVKLVSGMKLLQAVFNDLKGKSVPVETIYMGGRVL